MKIKIQDNTIKISNRVSTIFYNGYTLPEAMMDFLQTCETHSFI